MYALVKNFGIELCYLMCFEKFSNIKRSIGKKVIEVIILFAAAVIASYLESRVGIIRVPFMYAYGLIYIELEYNTCRSRIMKSIVSFAYSYLVFVIAAIIASLITAVISLDFAGKYGQYICFIIQLILAELPFQVARMKKGLPYEKNNYLILPGVCLSILAIIFAIMLGKNSYSYVYLAVYVAVFIIFVALLIYWKISITRSYLERLSNRNIASLNEELLQKDEYIKKLEADVERLGKIVHRDNKLVPAMEMAVERFIMDESGEMSTGSELLEELRKMSKDRKGLVTASVNAAEPSVNTGVAKVDNLITYMSEKAANEGITLKVTVGIDIKELFDKCIDEESFCTLLADLLDNAIIATKYNNARDVLLDMSMIKKAPAIHIFDSGISFDKEVLINYGIEQTTTHGDDGGSGIGLMQTYEILAKCRASIFIDEFSSGLYTKKISVVFDRKRQFLLYTPREDSEVSFLKRRADLTVVRK